MVVITVQVYARAGVHTKKVGNRKLFWVKMIDLKKGLGLKIFLIQLENKYKVCMRLNILRRNKKQNI